MELKRIYKPIEKDLEKVDVKIRSALKNKDEVVSTINEYVLSTPGKRLRPALALLSAKTGGNKNNKIYDLAAGIEIIHVATLVHDDIIDGAKKRRNKNSINAKWGSRLAILYGDFLYSRALRLVSGIEDFILMRKLSSAADSMCSGEILQLGSVQKRKITEKEYLKVISKKTAALFEISCEGGAILGGLSRKSREALREYGFNFGIVFQMVDDYLDHVHPRKSLKKKVFVFADKAKKSVSAVQNSLIRDCFVDLVDYVVGKI